MKVFISAAGNGARWREYSGVPKQLAIVNNEPLLERTIRLLHDENVNDIYIVGHDATIKVQGGSFFDPPKSQCVVETLLSTRDLWGESNLFSLGDVFFTKNQCRILLVVKGPLRCMAEKRRVRLLTAVGPKSSHLALNERDSTTYSMLLTLSCKKQDLMGK